MVRIEGGCGGTLIGARHVLTAAHCFSATKKGVYVGDHDRTIPDGEEYFEIESWIPHPKRETGIFSIKWPYQTHSFKMKNPYHQNISVS